MGEMGQKKQHALDEQDVAKSLDHENQVIDNNDDDKSKKQLKSENQDFPSGLKLGFIFTALCLTVFLVALVRIQKISAYFWMTLWNQHNG